MLKLKNYTKRELEAAMRMKGTNATQLSRDLGKCHTTVGKVISGKAAWVGKDLEKAIVEALQPDLEIIHQAYQNVMQSTMISAETRLGIMSREG